MYLLKGVEDEETASVLSGADAVLVFEAGVSKRLDFSFLTHFGIFGDRWILFVKGGIVLFERCRYPKLIFEGRIREKEAGDFACFRASKTDLETRLEENFFDSLKVVVLWLADDGGEGLNGGFVVCGDVR